MDIEHHIKWTACHIIPILTYHYTFKSVTDRYHFDHCVVLCEITAISMTDIGRQIHRSVKRGLRLHKETLSLLSSTIMLQI